MNDPKDIFTVFSDNLIKHIPDNIDEKNIERYFTYYYAHFALSTYDIFMDINLIDDEGRYTLPLYTFLKNKVSEYEKNFGEIKDTEKKWLALHVMVIAACADSFNMSLMRSICKMVLSKINGTDKDLLVHYVNQLNIALMSESGITLVPRSIEIAKTGINGEKGFSPFFNEILKSIVSTKEVLKKRVKVKEIKDISDYIDKDFTKYIKKHDALAEYFSGIIILKRNILIKKETDSDKEMLMKDKMLEFEIEKFINNTCSIDDDNRKRLLQRDLINIVNKLVP